MPMLNLEDRKLLATVKPEYLEERYVKKADMILLKNLKKEKELRDSHVKLEENPSEKLTMTDVKINELNDDALSFIRKIADARKMSLSDAVSELYHSYPWHVMACETDQKRLYDSGIVITVKEDLMDVMNKERAKYYVMGRNNKKIEELPAEVGSLINA